MPHHEHKIEMEMFNAAHDLNLPLKETSAVADFPTPRNANYRSYR